MQADFVLKPRSTIHAYTPQKDTLHTSLGDLQTSQQEHAGMLHAVSRVRVHTPYRNREQQSTSLHIIYGMPTLSMGSHQLTILNKVYCWTYSNTFSGVTGLPPTINAQIVDPTPFLIPCCTWKVSCSALRCCAPVGCWASTTN